MFQFQEPQSSNVKRPPSNPIDITGHCRLSSAYPNVLNVTWAANYGQRHCIVVRLVRQHNSQILLDRLKKHIRNVDHSKVCLYVCSSFVNLFFVRLYIAVSTSTDDRSIEYSVLYSFVKHNVCPLEIRFLCNYAPLQNVEHFLRKKKNLHS